MPNRRRECGRLTHSERVETAGVIGQGLHRALDLARQNYRASASPPSVRWRTGSLASLISFATSLMPGLAPTTLLNARQADIDFTVNIAPLLRIPQSTHQLFEGFAVFRCIFEPREEVERLAKFPTVVQAPGDGRQIFQAAADVARLFLEDSTALILS